jgi:23S rRNA (cytosine1962-C5)-methyltransferase
MNIESLIMEGVEKRLQLFDSPETDCFRLINGAGDGLDGITVDRFGSYILVQVFDPSLIEEKDDTPVLKRRYRDALNAAAGRFPCEVKGLLLKNREKLKGGRDFVSERRSGLIDGNYPPDDFTVIQNGVTVKVDLVEGQSTGIFLDMREIRDLLAEFYRQNECSSMLNLFCYTALFSVHALKNGLRHAVNVDLARAVLSRARENYALNGFPADDRDFIYGDALEWIRRLKKRKETYSVIVIDPPTFARNRKKNFSVREDYAAAISALEYLAPGGYVLSAGK